MLEDFLSYIKSNLSVFRKDKVLLSVSGGIDSMVMLHMFKQLNFNIIVAHINHSTRNGGSDHDMNFVKTYCARNNIPFRSKILAPDKLSEGNFQDNARKERFAFLAQIKKKDNCKWIATAHHKEDRWETFLMHLNRKSGIQGLTSLRPKENSIIHPFLIFSKEQIITYGETNNVNFVHDKSNDSDDYTRNVIRNHITPKIAHHLHDFVENVNKSIHLLGETASLLDELINKNEFVSKDLSSGNIEINIKYIKTFRHQQGLLYHILEKYGFNYSTTCDILKTTKTGAQFESTQHQGVFNRGILIIRKKQKLTITDIKIDSPGIYTLPDGRRINIKINDPNEVENHLWLDESKVKWPLSIRNIQPGDKFKPHGMNGATKTLKKLCTDLKVSRFEKEKIFLVCQENTILQVVGIRTSHEYVTNDIKNALTFSIID